MLGDTDLSVNEIQTPIRSAVTAAPGRLVKIASSVEGLFLVYKELLLPVLRYTLQADIRQYIIKLKSMGDFF